MTDTVMHPAPSGDRTNVVAAREGGTAVAWSAILAGAVAAAALTFILILLGAGLGLSVSSPWSMTAEGAAALGVGTIIWLIVTQWIAAGIGGYLTGRLRTKWVGLHDHEAFFRDTAHGLLAWCLAVVVSGVIFALAGLAAIGGVGLCRDLGCFQRGRRGCRGCRWRCGRRWHGHGLFHRHAVQAGRRDRKRAGS